MTEKAEIRHWRRRVVGVTMALIWAGSGAALAEPLGGKDARKLVFPPIKAEAVIRPDTGLSPRNQDIVRQVALQQLYYGAIAIAPDQGLMAETTVAAANYHDTAAAAARALAGCEEKRGGQGRPCIVVAEIRPEGWAPRPLQLSSDATQALRKQYRKGRAPKALAISPATGKWAIAKGDGAPDQALRQCDAESGQGDCRLAVAD